MTRRYWAFYADLLAYRRAPPAARPRERERLRAAFRHLFGTATGYPALDARLATTLAHERELLLVLDHPELPLHNNASELAVRRRVRKRDVSFGPLTRAGARRWDTFHTLAGTAQKLGVDIFHYLRDRVSGAHRCQPGQPDHRARPNRRPGRLLGWSRLPQPQLTTPLPREDTPIRGVTPGICFLDNPFIFWHLASLPTCRFSHRQEPEGGYSVPTIHAVSR